MKSNNSGHVPVDCPITKGEHGSHCCFYPGDQRCSTCSSNGKQIRRTLASTPDQEITHGVRREPDRMMTSP